MPAVDDSYEYLTDPNSAEAIANAKAAGADTVCRSYLFYGTAQDASGNQSDHNDEYMYFMVRVERNLDTFQQTVTVSAPASLLAVEKVYITEDTTGSTPKYTAKVEEANPAHVIYEVGLRSDINEYNVDAIVGKDTKYTGETPNGSGHVNYEDGTYYFFTNDWDRAKLGTHESAMSKATFYAATNNPYYTYQEDTYLYVNGSKIKAIPADNPNDDTDDVYYNRTVYAWSDETNEDGEYIATKKTEKIKVSIPAGAAATADGALRADKDGYLYIAKGTYTAAVMSPDGSEDVGKGSGHNTNTSDVVAHPVRTGDADDAHYTVHLGNNGVLSLTPQKSKTVSINLDPNATTITDDNGKVVMVGDTLTYTVEVKNTTNSTATVTVTDMIPAGTELVDDSITENGEASNGVITWTFADMAAGESETVSFQVKVTEDALTGEVEVNDITNTATVKIGNTVLYNTNTTKNPPEGKKAVAGDTQAIEGALKVGDVITYRIRYFNDNPKGTDNDGNPLTSNVIITDTIPSGTTYVADSASHKEYLTISGEQLQWTIPVVNGEGGVVSFRVAVDASAKVTQIEDTPAEGVQPSTGTIQITNGAKIQIGETNPRVTNTTTHTADVGNISIKKVLDENDVEKFKDKSFSVILTESEGKLNGTYQMTGSSTQTTAAFRNGQATVLIKHGETLVIQGIPQGALISVTENLTDENAPGWSDAYDNEYVTVAVDDAETDNVNEATGKSDNPDVTITNSYNPRPVSFQLKGTKYFVGTNFPNGTFTFTAEQCNADGGAYTGEDKASVSGKVSTDADGVAIFTLSGRTFYAATTKARYYIISEDAISYPGLYTDGKQYMLKLEIKDDGTGSLNAVTQYRSRANSTANWSDWADLDWATNSTSISFTNEYPANGSVTINGKKVLDNRNINANEFSFRLLAEDGKTVIANAIAVGDGTSNEGNFTFNLTYSAADMVENGVTVDTKTFEYYVEEVNNSLPGVTYDATRYEVIVTVSRGTGENVGKLVPSITSVTKVAATDEDGAEPALEANNTNEAIVFRNTYTPDSVTVKLSATKTLKVNDPTHTSGLAAGAFSFGVYRADENYNIIDSDADNDITDEEVIVGGTNAAGTSVEGGYAGNVSFSDLTYTHAFFLQNAVDTDDDNEKDTMTRHYVVKEIVPAQDGPTFNPNMQYSTVQHKVKVVVTDGDDGKLSAQVYVDGSTTAADAKDGVYAVGDFTNTLQASEIGFTHTGSKVTKGNNLPDGLRFSFTVNSATVSDNKVTSVGGVAGTGISNATQGQTASSAEGTDVYQETTGIAFTELRFSDKDLGTALSKDFHYVIKESNTAAGNGVTYDPARYLLTVTLSRDEETRVLSVSGSYHVLNTDNSIGDIADKPSFTNTYAATGHINLTATKALTGDAGRTLGHREFDFELQRLGTDGKLIEGSEITGVNGELTDNDGKPANQVTFATLNFTSDMLKQENGFTQVVDPDDESTTDVDETETYWLANYLMSEVKPDGVAIPGITYDPNKYIVTIKVKQVTEGSDSGLDVALHGVYAVDVNGDIYIATGENRLSEEEATANSTGETFTNTYRVSATTATIVASKKLTGRTLRADEFTYELYRVDADSKEHLVTAATNDADGNISFTRTYNTAVLSAGGFTSDTNGNQMMDYTVTYHLKEVDPTQGGVTHESGEYWVKVVIDHNTANASYVITSISYYSDAACTDDGWISTVFPTAVDADNQQDNAQAAVEFVNKYQPTATSFTPAAQKQLQGKGGSLMSVTQNQFSFRVVELDSTKTTELGIVSTGYNNAATEAAADVSFTSIGYSGAGKHYYKITENPGVDSTITYDDTAFYLLVDVEDNQNGTLSIKSYQYYSDSGFSIPIDADKVVFTNHYGSGVIDIQLALKKTVEVYNAQGKLDNYQYPLEDSQFDFHVYQGTGDSAQRVAHGTNDADGNITFTSIPVTRADVINSTSYNEDLKQATFIYTVKEVASSESTEKTGITTDDKVITATVVVKDDGYGNLSYDTITYTDNDDNSADDTFVNQYNMKSTTFTPTAVKTLINKKLAENEFSFKLEGEGTSETKSNDASGKVTFTALTYVRPGVYTYSVTEMPKVTDEGQTDTRYTCDPTVYKLVVTVSPDTSGQLHAVPMYYKVEGTGENKKETAVGGITFTNTYTPGSLTNQDLNLSIGAKKQVVDNNGTVIDPSEREDLYRDLKFVVLNNRGENVFGEGVYGTCGAGGNITFPAFNFTTAGEYHYIIREVSGAKTGFTYDTTEWTVHILVRYNNTNEELKDSEGNKLADPGSLYIIPSEVHTFPETSAAQDDQGTALQTEIEPLFKNVYNPAPVDVTVKATKTLEGRNQKDHEFNFVMTDENGKLVYGQDSNRADGSVSFQKTYTMADMVGATLVDGKYTKTFTYVIKEIIPDGATDKKLNGVTYTDTPKTVTVTVVDEGGTLTVNGENSTTVDAGAFVNSYTAKPVSVEIIAQKVLEGAT